MRSRTPNPIPYRGFDILIQVDRAGDRIFGHADVFANDEFKARLSVGSTRRRTREIRDRLRCLAKSKVDVWSLAGPSGAARPH